ncbi:hypothetical protein NB703_003469 [Pantoea ananatis]|uniref:Uncharacterized protein n=1 Tax=Pantoea ananas TaxID=553 RepID=A0AAJ1D205_PANAN|nr:hypothetical protein [Pantoea ananatis]
MFSWCKNRLEITGKSADIDVMQSWITGPAWGCSISAVNMAMPGWKTPASRHCYWSARGVR